MFDEQNLHPKVDEDSTCTSDLVAIIGADCKAPGASSTNELWDNLCKRKISVDEFPRDRLDLWDDGENWPGKAGLVKNIQYFDPSVFGISKTEASMMDPQQRMILMASWNAFQDAGISPTSLRGSNTGVFIGASNFDYGWLGASRSFSPPLTTSPFSGLGIAHSIIANRVSFCFDLKGPSACFDTACSSSLLALHHACVSLKNGACDLALIGGVNLILTSKVNDSFRCAGMLSEDWLCKSFDEDADGYVRAEGSVAVVAKRLDEALRDGDRILGVVSGTSANQDGQTPTISSPDSDQQFKCLTEVMRISGVSADDIQVVEAHGTGTKLGDATELYALWRLFEGIKHKVVVGSVKANIGHAESASGLLGLVRVLKSLEHEVVPAHPRDIMPRILDFDYDSVLDVNTRPVKWLADAEPRKALISSFGFGGTNVGALILGPEVIKGFSACKLEKSECHSKKVERFYLSSPTIDRFSHLIDYLLATLESVSEQEFNGWLQTWNKTHPRFKHTKGASVSDKNHLFETLNQWKDDLAVPHKAESFAITNKRNIENVALMFSGQGSQYAGMGADLCRNSSRAKHLLEIADGISTRILGQPISDIILDQGAESIDQDVNSTKFSQVAIFVVGYVVADFLRQRGLQINVLIGHSVGEFVAACVDGVFDFASGVEMVCIRGLVMEKHMPPGCMLAVSASSDLVRSVIDELNLSISIAAVNGPSSVIVSGSKKDMTHFDAEILNRTTKSGVFVKVNRAFHSEMTTVAAKKFQARISHIRFNSPTAALFSTVTGSRFNDTGIFPDAKYWANQMRSTVSFLDCVEKVLEEATAFFVEVGARAVLLPSVKKFIVDRGGDGIPTLKSPRCTDAQLNDVLDRVFASVGAYQASNACIQISENTRHLAKYPFKKDPYWLTDNHKPIQLSGHQALDRTGRSGVFGGRQTEQEGVYDRRVIFSDESLALFAEHVVGGKAIFPGAAYISLIQHWVELEFGLQSKFFLSDLKLAAAITISVGSKVDLYVSILCLDDKNYTLSFQYKSPDRQSYSTCCSANVVISRNSMSNRVDVSIDKVRAKVEEHPVHTQFYEVLQENGLDYGPNFRRVTHSFNLGDSDLRNQLKNGQGAVHVGVVGRGSRSEQFALSNPAHIDASLHLISELFRSKFSRDGSRDLLIPGAFGSVDFFGPQPDQSLVVLYETPGMAADNFLSCDLDLIGPDGTAWLKIRNVVLRRIPQPGQGRSAFGFVRWQLIDPPNVASSESADEPKGKFLKVINEGGQYDLRDIFLAKDPVQDDTEVAAMLPLYIDIELSQLGLELGEAEGLLVLFQSLIEKKFSNLLIVRVEGFASIDDSSELQAVGCMIASAVRAARWEAGFNVTLVDSPEMLSDNQVVEILSSEDLSQGRDVAFHNGSWYLNSYELEFIGASSKNTRLPAQFHFDAIGRGGPSSVWPVSCPQFELSDNQVKVEVVASGINFRDILKSLGNYPGNSNTPFWLGDEVAGTITEIGPGVSQFTVGDRIVAITPRAQASHVLVDCNMAMKIPQRWTEVDAATALIAYTTAYHCLVTLCGLSEGETVLINSAAGGVGWAGAQIAKMVGAKVIGSSGNIEKLSYLDDFDGAHKISVGGDLSITEQVLEVTGGKGADVVLNSLSEPYMTESMSSLNESGRFAEIGKLDFLQNTKIGLKGFSRQISYFSVDMEKFFEVSGSRRSALMSVLEAHFDSGALPPLPRKEFSFANVQNAYKYLASRAAIGKVVLKASPSDVREKQDAVLISGGTGALGLVAATWQVELGFRNILLLSRSGSNLKTDQFVNYASQRGVDVQVLSLNIADRDSLVSKLSSLPLKIIKIVHAAGVMKNVTIAAMTLDDLEAVFGAKVQGAENLVDAIGLETLEEFVAYSSMASLFGSHGQFNYSAANGWLDGFCGQLRSKGVKATALQWGPWDSGMASDADIKRNIDEIGLGFIEAGDYSAHLLDTIAHQPRSTVTLIKGDYLKFAKVHQFATNSHLMAPFLESKKQRSNGLAWSADEIFETLKKILSELSNDGLQDFALSSMLGEFGFDSLMGVELFMRIEEMFQVSLNLQAFSTESTIEQVVDELGRLLDGVEKGPIEVVKAEGNQTTRWGGASQEFDEVLALPSIDQNDYIKFVRPDYTSLLENSPIGTYFHAAEGDILKTIVNGQERSVVDFLGGYGANIFGHNHSQLTGTLVQLLRNRVGFNTQASLRAPAGTLAAELADRLYATTDEEYVAIFGSGGAEAVDIAIKLLLVRKSNQIERLEGANLMDARPIVICLEGSYHGKTLAAHSLTHGVSSLFGEEVSPYKVVWVNPKDESALTKIFSASTLEGQNYRGELLTLNKVVGVFIEPIQGEGGIRPVPNGFVNHAYELCQRHDVPLVFDEIQSGMGRTGRFLASESYGVPGDIYLLGKSLGGGVSKISATMIRRDIYPPGFGLFQTSTFAEDDYSAFVALRALSLYDQENIAKRCANLGILLLNALLPLKEMFPCIVYDVRGSGAMIGIELKVGDTKSSWFLRELFLRGLLGQLVAQALLTDHNIRVGTSTSNPNVIRVEPSAFIEEKHVVDLVSGFTDILDAIQHGDILRLVRGYLPALKDTGNSDVPLEIDQSKSFFEAGTFSVEDPDAIFLVHMSDENQFYKLLPGLEVIGSELLEKLQDAFVATTIPLELYRFPIAAKDGTTITFSIRVLPFTAKYLMNSVRNGKRAKISEAIGRSVRLSKQQRAKVVGLGGLLSVITNNGKDVQDLGVPVTTGNATTVGMLYKAFMQSSATTGKAVEKAEVCVVGAAGNIGKLLTNLLSDQVRKIKLIGRKGNIAAVVKLKQYLVDRGAEENQIFVSDDLTDAEGCDALICSTNSPVPVIDVSNVPSSVKVIYDVSFPPNVDENVRTLEEPPHIVRAGLVKVPMPPGTDLNLLGLSEGVVFACMAETAMVAIRCDYSKCSVGNVKADDVKYYLQTADELGFIMDEIVSTKPF